MHEEYLQKFDNVYRNKQNIRINSGSIKDAGGFLKRPSQRPQTHMNIQEEPQMERYQTVTQGGLFSNYARRSNLSRLQFCNRRMKKVVSTNPQHHSLRVKGSINQHPAQKGGHHLFSATSKDQNRLSLAPSGGPPLKDSASFLNRSSFHARCNTEVDSNPGGPSLTLKGPLQKQHQRNSSIAFLKQQMKLRKTFILKKGRDEGPNKPDAHGSPWQQQELLNNNSTNSKSLDGCQAA